MCRTPIPHAEEEETEESCLRFSMRKIVRIRRNSCIEFLEEEEALNEPYVRGALFQKLVAFEAYRILSIE